MTATIVVLSDATQLPPDALLAAFLERGFGPFVGVPCSFLGPLISCIQRKVPEEYIAAANEGEAVAVAAGSRLAGRKPVVLLQNSGLGNAVNPLTSLCQTLRIPILLMVTWRGRPGQPDEAQHELMGRITPDLLTAMAIHHELLPADAGAFVGRLAAADEHIAAGGSFTFVVPKGSIAPWSGPDEPALERARPMRRVTAIATVMAGIDAETLVVATTGKTARELERDHDRARNLYVVGSMGCASSIALGISRGSQRPIVVLDGDGAAMMRLEAMAAIGRLRPSPFVHLVLDNESYDSTGGQPTNSAAIDFAAVAAACGYAWTADVSEAPALQEALATALRQDGPALVRIRIGPGSEPGLGRPALRPPESSARFAAAVRS